MSHSRLSGRRQTGHAKERSSCIAGSHGRQQVPQQRVVRRRPRCSRPGAALLPRTPLAAVPEQHDAAAWAPADTGTGGVLGSSSLLWLRCTPRHSIGSSQDAHLADALCQGASGASPGDLGEQALVTRHPHCEPQKPFPYMH